MQYENLTIIGTSHIAGESIEKIKKFIEEKKPDIVALELDKNRFISLTRKQKPSYSVLGSLKFGLFGSFFLLVGHWAQKLLGKSVGVIPGAEMLTAIKLARKYNLSITLIDQDIEITLRRLSSQVGIRERLKIITDIIRSLLFRENELKKLGVSSIDLTKVPDGNLIRKMILLVKERYPNLYRVLIEERNQVMATNLVALLEENRDKTILAVLGAGHEEEILSLIKKYDTQTSYSFRIGL